MSKQQEYEWNGLRVRRDGEGEWEWFVDPHWQRLTRVVDTPLHAGVAAELDRLYPLPRTVTLDNGEVWHKIGPEDEYAAEEGINEWREQDGQSYFQYEGGMLDTIDRLQNGDDR